MVFAGSRESRTQTSVSPLSGRLVINQIDIASLGSFQGLQWKGNVIQAGLGAHNYCVRVCNRDFVTDNLNFLVSQQFGGEIRTFAIVGEQNKEIDDTIAAIEATLGSIEGKVGMDVIKLIDYQIYLRDFCKIL